MKNANLTIWGVLIGCIALIIACNKTDAIETDEHDTNRDSETATDADVDEATDTTKDQQRICPLSDDETCGEFDSPFDIPLAFSLDTTGIEGATIQSVIPSFTENFGESGYLVGIMGTGLLENETRPFLIVFQTQDPSKYTINWLNENSGEKIFGLRRARDAEYRWSALVCGEECFVARSQATAEIKEPLSRDMEIDVFNKFKVNGVARSYTDAPPVIFGEGLARLEENGTWSLLIPPGSGSEYRAGFIDPIVAVGDHGRISVYSESEASEISSGTTDSLTSVWARFFVEGGKTHLIVHAFGREGQAYFTNAYGNGAMCPFAEGVVATFEARGGVVVATDKGDMYIIGRNVYERIQCKVGFFEGSIIDASSFFCGIGGNIIGWSRTNVFTRDSAFCAVD